MAQLLLLRNVGNARSITLNRAKALNALNPAMVTELRDMFVQWDREHPNLSAIVMKGAGGKAFCAGGDVKSIWSEINAVGLKAPQLGTGNRGFSLSSEFFRTEYEMNYLIGTSLVPQVSLWDGIVMGGGVGVSAHGRFRVATEKAMFAMPETAIGLFPDVGSSFWLPHLQFGYGMYIGLTGARLFAADLVHSGIATHFVSSDKLETLETALGTLPGIGTPQEKAAKVKEVLDDFSSKSGSPDVSKSVLIPNTSTISSAFEGAASIEAIISRLTSDSLNPWAVDTAKTLLKMSPMSLKLTLQQINRGKHLSDLGDCLKMEFRLVQGCMRSPDFSEGVRALLVDKDNKPKWIPSSLGEVSDEFIDSFFDPLPSDNDFDATIIKLSPEEREARDNKLLEAALRRVPVSRREKY